MASDITTRDGVRYAQLTRLEAWIGHSAWRKWLVDRTRDSKWKARAGSKTITRATLRELRAALAATVKE